MVVGTTVVFVQLQHIVGMMQISGAAKTCGFAPVKGKGIDGNA
jgi:hypothetical protein